MAALVRFNRAGGRRITFEYTMIRGVNDAPRLAPQLADLASSIDAFVNLIPYNPIPYQDWRASRGERIEEFRSVLESRGVSKETFPERLIILDPLPRTPAGKVKKGTLVELLRSSR